MAGGPNQGWKFSADGREVGKVAGWQTAGREPVAEYRGMSPFHPFILLLAGWQRERKEKAGKWIGKGN